MTQARAEVPVVVVGAGAAGLMAAVCAASTGARVVLLERTRDGGRKILISGGGRCNILPAELQPARFVTASSPNTLRNLLRAWPLEEQRAFFESTLAIPLAFEAETSKWFPASNSAREVRDALVREARQRGVEIRFEARVLDVVPASAPREPGAAEPGAALPEPGATLPEPGAALPEPSAALPESRAVEAGTGRWRVLVEGSTPIEARAVILATGGLSVPATGSDGIGLAIARRLGHTIHDTYPALTPLVADPAIHGALAGVSTQVRLRADRNAKVLVTHGGFLFTHRGYSGPAVLDISHLAVRARLAGQAQAIRVQWSIEHDEAAWQRLLQPRNGSGASGQGLVVSRLRQHLPNRLADWLVADAGVPLECPMASLTRAARASLIERLCRYPLPWTADEGYKKAEVTGGGVALDEVDPRTLESRRHPGLFLCGEMLDAFGPIGGHNFSWAWSTGRLAGLGAAVSH